MRDSQPHLLKEMYIKGTLQKHVVTKAKAANERYWRLIDQGVDKMTANEMRLDMIAPAEGMEIEREEVISDELFETILDEVTRRDDDVDDDAEKAM